MPLTDTPLRDLPQGKSWQSPYRIGRLNLSGSLKRLSKRYLNISVKP
ncbi:MAG: hypothetical protein IKZ88_05845 [Neisseriaceae bacterium]|nr:hypothetical protein [Neisseriaceae bacterium]